MACCHCLLSRTMHLSSSAPRLHLLPSRTRHRIPNPQRNPNFVPKPLKSSRLFSSHRLFCHHSQRSEDAELSEEAEGTEGSPNLEGHRVSVGIGNPSFPVRMRMYRMSLGDQGFFLLAFIACTETHVKHQQYSIIMISAFNCYDVAGFGARLSLWRKCHYLLILDRPTLSSSQVNCSKRRACNKGLKTSVAFTSLVIAAVPTLCAMKRAATSLARLADTAREELPSTMAAIRLSGMEISDLTLELSDLSQEIADGVSKSAQAVQAAEAGIRQIGALARSRTMSMIQERANLPNISLQPVVAGAAKKTSNAVGHAKKTFMNLISGGGEYGSDSEEDSDTVEY